MSFDENPDSVVPEPERHAGPVAVESVGGTGPAETGPADTIPDPPKSGGGDPRIENSRFRIFVIDSGWNHPASKVLNENFDLIHALTDEDPIYVLDKDKSIELLRKNKGLIGHDPIIAVHDVTARGIKKHLGFRLHLGLLDDETQCLASLKMFSRFINTHRQSRDLEADVRRKLHKQGVSGAIEIVGGAAHHVMMEA
jgi:hypothetical protein